MTKTRRGAIARRAVLFARAAYVVSDDRIADLVETGRFSPAPRHTAALLEKIADRLMAAAAPSKEAAHG